MLALEPLIKARLEALAELDGWTVRGATEAVDRKAPGPSVDLRIGAVAVPDSKTGAAVVQPAWDMVFEMQRGPTAAATLDAIFWAVLQDLQGWEPGNVGGREWLPLKLAAASPPDFLAEGVAAVALSFSTGAGFIGQA